jgi:alkylation response protein AidB-like acyl-CoA dehydrogenase
VYLALTDEQGFLSEAAAGLLSRVPTLESARSALDGEPFVDLWPNAVDAGWPGLLSAEEVDGAGLGVYEALLVLEACGARLADARLIGHLSACAVLEREGGDSSLRRSLALGEVRAAFVDSVSGPVIDAIGADVLVTPDGEIIDPARVQVEAQPSYDGTRSLGRMEIVVAEGTALGSSLQRALLAAESVGAASACLEMSRRYAIDRHAFGRSIGSYQAIKHKLVEMMRRIEGARSLLVGVGRAWSAGDPAEFVLLANAARVSAIDALDYAAAENIFIHGGVGATWEHDAQLYYRRAELSRRLAGGAEAAADDVAEALFARTAAGVA